ncbi:MAG: acetate--CoA ligase family protein [Streptosporangiaceae bacterium]|jgi:acyl-CoA synthetase (NDP forming)
MTLQAPGARTALVAMLEARSVAVVGASSRPGTFGERMLAEVAASPARPEIYPVNPRYAEIGGRRAYPSLADLPGPVDLVLLGVPDAALQEQLMLAASRGDRAAVIYGNAHEDPAARSAGRPSLRGRLAAIATAAGMELCGAGCMGFVNVAGGLRATGYVEPDPLPAGPAALVTHSGSVFSAMLRMRRGIGFTLAVSAGQELVTAAPSYLDYALGLPQTRVLALVLEAIRQPALLRTVLGRAAERDIPVILLTVGRSVRGRLMVAAHSGALAAADGGWEALARAYGVHRVGDLAELTDTLELFAIGRPAVLPRRTAVLPRRAAVLPRRAAPPPQAAGGTPEPFRPASGDTPAPPRPARPASGDTPAPPRPARPASGAGIATVHDSGLERAHAADLAEQLGVPFAQIGAATKGRLAQLLDPGLEPGNPLDVWGTGADTRGLFAGSLVALAGDPSVAVVVLAVDLVRELDGDDSYPLAVMDAARRTGKPLAVLSNLPSAMDQDLAERLRRARIPVLEGLRSGLLALGHLLDQARARSRYSPSRSIVDEAGSHAADPLRPRSAVDWASSHAAGPALQRPAPDQASHGAGPALQRPAPDRGRRRRAVDLLDAAATGGAPLLELLREYGIASAHVLPADTASAALRAAEAIGYPVVLKTDEPAIRHKSDARGVVLGVGDRAELATAYGDLAARLGPRVLVGETIPAGIELALGIARDPALGPLIVVGAGGVLVEVLGDRAVALPPVDERTATELIGELRIASLLSGFRGAPPADLDSIVRAITGLSALAGDLGEELAALDVNPLICGPAGAVAVDALAIRRGSAAGESVGGGLSGPAGAAQEVGE